MVGLNQLRQRGPAGRLGGVGGRLQRGAAPGRLRLCVPLGGEEQVGLRGGDDPVQADGLPPSDPPEHPAAPLLPLLGLAAQLGSALDVSPHRVAPLHGAGAAANRRSVTELRLTEPRWRLGGGRTQRFDLPQLKAPRSPTLLTS